MNIGDCAVERTYICHDEKCNKILDIMEFLFSAFPSDTLFMISKHNNGDFYLNLLYIFMSFSVSYILFHINV